MQLYPSLLVNKQLIRRRLLQIVPAGATVVLSHRVGLDDSLCRVPTTLYSISGGPLPF